MSFQIKSVQVNAGYQLSVRFKNGQSKLFDMKPFLNKGIFKELKNESYFQKVRVVWGGIEWPHEQDLSADTLYYGGLPSKKK
ncbi:MAG: DUF2442 domain-containing protein [Chlamydiae bacterium]|nr:DUF2442 domain-containing protein [Chlamydiota bacterium]MBI3278043.1 DUF2442 domain-containing protein [Chlamydiota bacterium]